MALLGPIAFETAFSPAVDVPITASDATGGPATVSDRLVAIVLAIVRPKLSGNVLGQDLVIAPGGEPVPGRWPVYLLALGGLVAGVVVLSFLGARALLRRSKK